MPFNPNDELDMRFTVTEWNTVIAQLRKGPYEIVEPLITKINIQAAQHEQAQRQPAGDVSYVNGELHPPEPLPAMTEPLPAMTEPLPTKPN